MSRPYRVATKRVGNTYTAELWVGSQGFTVARVDVRDEGSEESVMFIARMLRKAMSTVVDFYTRKAQKVVARNIRNGIKKAAKKKTSNTNR